MIAINLSISGGGAPTVTTAPIIAGIGSTGETLTVTPGVYTGSPVVTRQWRADAVDISGATDLTYIVVEANDGAVFTCVETATNTAGSVVSASNAISEIPSGAWATASIASFDSPSSTWAGSTGRMRVNPSEFDFAGDSIRLTAQAWQSLPIDGAQIWIGKEGAAPYDFDGSQQQVMWGGSPTLNLATGEDMKSDPVAMAYDPAVDGHLVISFQIDAASTSDDIGAQTSKVNWSATSDASLTAGDTIAAGTSSLIRDAYLIDQIELSTDTLPAASWVNAAAMTFDNDSPNWELYTARVSALASALPVPAQKMRITVTADDTQPTIIDDFFAGISDGTHAFTVAPTRITFGGLNTISLLAGESIVSDEIDLTYDPVTDAGVVFALYKGAGTTGENLGAQTSRDGWTTYFRSGNDTQNVPGTSDGESVRDVVAISNLEFLSGVGIESAWVGALSAESATVALKFTRECDATLQRSVSSDMSSPTEFGPFRSERNVLKVVSDGALPDTQYYYRITAGGEIIPGPVRSFTTAPAANAPASFNFCVSSCASTGSESAVYTSIRDEGALFFQHLGDFHYENIAVNYAQLFRNAFDTVLASSTFAALMGTTAVFYMFDDHCYGDNDSNKDSPSRRAALKAYRERVPHHPLVETDEATAVYQTWTIGRVVFILTDLRSMASPESDVDNASKTKLGAVQKQWLKDVLADSANDDRAFVWFSTSTWNVTADASEDHWGGYATEREELANYIAATRPDLVRILSGDMHATGASVAEFATVGVSGIREGTFSPLDRSNGTWPGTWDTGLFQNNGQYGLITVTDTGTSTIGINLKGKTTAGTVLFDVDYDVVLPV